MAMYSDQFARFDAAAEAFSSVVGQVNDWAAPSPVDGWLAADIVWHLTDWIPQLFNSSSDVELPVRDVDESPADAWSNLAATINESLASDNTRNREFSNPQVGNMCFAQAIDMLVTPDVFMHTWDLAEAADVQVSLDASYAQELLDGMRPIESVLRASGHYGPAVEPPPAATTVVQLMCFVGRDPNWDV